MAQRQVTLQDLWQIAWRRKFWLILPVVIVTAVAFGGSYLLPTVYESSTKIVISDLKFISPDLERMLPDEVGGPPRRGNRGLWLASTRSEIKSSGYINEMINRLNLEPSESVVTTAEKMRAQFPENNLSTMIRTLQIEALKDRIDVSMIGDNQIIIYCRSQDPRQAADMATALAEIYRERKLTQQVIAGQESRTLTDQQLAIAQKAFEDAEQELSEFKRAYIEDNLDEGISSDMNQNLIKSEIDATKLELTEARDRRDFLAQRAIEAGVDTAQLLDEAEKLGAYTVQALEHTRTISSLMTKYVWRDGKIQGQLVRISEELDSIREGGAEIVESNYPNLTSSEKSEVSEFIYRTHEIDFLREKREILSEANNNIRNVIAGMPYYQQMVKRLEEKVEERRRTLNTWQDQADKARIRQATTEAEAETKYSILEPASIPLSPSSPNRLKITLMGLALGLLLGGCAVILTEVLDHSVKRIEDIEELLNLEVVGTIPNIDEATKVKNVAVD